MREIRLSALNRKRFLHIRKQKRNETKGQQFSSKVYIVHIIIIIIIKGEKKVKKEFKNKFLLLMRDE